MATYDAVYLRSDDRREAANALDDYLKTHLWLERSALTDLIILNCDSSKSPLVQFSNMLTGVVQYHHEDGKSDPWCKFTCHIEEKPVF